MKKNSILSVSQIMIRAYSICQQEVRFKDMLKNAKNFYAINQYLPLKKVEDCISMGYKSGEMDIDDELFLLKRCGKSALDADETVRKQLSKDLWKKIITKNISVDVFNTYIKNAMENNVGVNASSIFEDMKSKNITPDFYTYFYLVQYYCQNGCIDSAERILDLMEKENIPIEQNIYNNLIIGYARAKNAEGCEKLSEIMKDKRMKLNRKTCSSLLIAYAELNMDEKFKDVMKEAIINSISISSRALLQSFVSFAAHKNEMWQERVLNVMSSNMQIYMIYDPLKKLLLKKDFSSVAQLISRMHVNCPIITNFLLKNTTIEEMLKICEITYDTYSGSVTRTFVFDFKHVLYHHSSHSTLKACLKIIKLAADYHYSRGYVYPFSSMISPDDFGNTPKIVVLETLTKPDVISAIIEYLNTYEDEKYTSERFLHFLKMLNENDVVISADIASIVQNHFCPNVPDEINSTLTQLQIDPALRIKSKQVSCTGNEEIEKIQYKTNKIFHYYSKQESDSYCLSTDETDEHERKLYSDDVLWKHRPASIWDEFPVLYWKAFHVDFNVESSQLLNVLQSLVDDFKAGMIKKFDESYETVSQKFFKTVFYLKAFESDTPNYNEDMHLLYLFLQIRGYIASHGYCLQSDNWESFSDCYSEDSINNSLYARIGLRIIYQKMHQYPELVSHKSLRIAKEAIFTLDILKSLKEEYKEEDICKYLMAYLIDSDIYEDFFN